MSIPVLSGVLDGAEWWQRNVAEGLLGNAIGDKGVRDALRLGITRYLLPDEEKFANVRPGMSPSQVVDTAYADDPWRRFAATTLTDPLTYVGMGIPGRIAGALPAASKAATALRALNWVDQAPSALTGHALGAAGSVVGPIVHPLAEAADKAISGAFAASPQATRAAEVWNNALRGWREQALFALPYHMRNTLDNVIKPIAGGDLETAGNYTKYLLSRGKSDPASDLLHQMNWREFPEGLLEGTPSPSVYRKMGERPYGPPVPGEGVGPTGQLMPAQGVLGKVGDAIGPAMEGNRRLGNFFEGGARKAAFNTEAQKVLDSKAAELAGELRSAGLGNIADDLVERAGQVSSDDLSRALMGAGVAQPDRIRLRGSWEMAQREAQQAGLDYANKLFFDYGTHGPLDKLGSNLFAFHKFASHNLPYFLQESLARPANATIPTDYYRVSDAYNQRHGLPASYHGEMPVGTLGGNDLYLNPMKWWSFGELVGAATAKEREHPGETALGSTAQTLKELGLGLNPAIDAVLAKSGQYGEGGFGSGLFRMAQPINGALSMATGHQVDIEGPLKDALAPPNPFPYAEYLRNKRLAEMSIRDTRQTNNPDYVHAMVDPNDPLAQKGEAETARFQGALKLINALTPGTLKAQNEEEQLINGNQGLARQARAMGNQAFANTNPTRRAYDYSSLIPEIQQFSHLPPDRQKQLMSDPAARVLIQEMMSQRLHSGQPPIPGLQAPGVYRPQLPPQPQR